MDEPTGVSFGSASEKLGNAEKMTIRVSDEIRYAISLYAVWDRCRLDQALLIAVGPQEVRPGFVVIRDSIHINLIMSLSRLYDQEGGYKLASIPALINQMSDPEILGWIEQDSIRNTKRDVILSFYSSTNNLRRNSIRTLRNKILAHNEVGIIEHGAKYGDETKLLMETMKLVSEIAALFREGYPPVFEETLENWRKLADSYWSFTIGAPWERFPRH